MAKIITVEGRPLTHTEITAMINSLGSAPYARVRRKRNFEAGAAYSEADEFSQKLIGGLILLLEEMFADFGEISAWVRSMLIKAGRSPNIALKEIAE